MSICGGVVAMRRALMRVLTYYFAHLIRSHLQAAYGLYFTAAARLGQPHGQVRYILHLFTGQAHAQR